MPWFRSAALWLVLTAIVAGAVWLFWGKDLERLWKKTKENPVVKEKIPKNLEKEIEKKKAELKKMDIPRPQEAIDLAKQIPVNANAEWQKTRSGAEGLVAAQKRETVRDLKVLAVRNDSRMIEILKQVRLYKEPKPAALFPPEPPPVKKVETKAAESPKKAKETTKRKKEPEKKKEPLRPML